MADYLILQYTGGTWGVVNLIGNQTANADGERAAIVESFQGPGRYVALRIDNARVVDVTVEPKLTEVVAEEEPPPEEPAEEEPAEEPEEPAEEPAEEPPVDEGEEPEVTP